MDFFLSCINNQMKRSSVSFLGYVIKVTQNKSRSARRYVDALGDCKLTRSGRNIQAKGSLRGSSKFSRRLPSKGDLYHYFSMISAIIGVINV